MEKLQDLIYAQGYRDALFRVISELEGMEQDIKTSREFPGRKKDLQKKGISYNYKTALKVVNFMLENRIVLRANNNAFVRTNPKTESGLEIFFEKGT